MRAPKDVQQKGANGCEKIGVQDIGPKKRHGHEIQTFEIFTGYVSAGCPNNVPRRYYGRADHAPFFRLVAKQSFTIVIYIFFFQTIMTKTNRNICSRTTTAVFTKFFMKVSLSLKLI